MASAIKIDSRENGSSAHADAKLKSDVVVWRMALKEGQRAA